MLLPFCVLGAEVVGSGVLQIWRQDDGFIASFAWQLNTQVPRIEGDEGEFEIFGDEVFVGEGVKPANCITESTCIANVFPREGGETRYTPVSSGTEDSAAYLRDSLHKGVIGVLTGLTRMLSRCS